MTDDAKKFDYILARSRTRESSTLTIATVASSASLVLIALYIQAVVDIEVHEKTSPSFDNYKLWIQGMGLSFPLMGFLYREITAHTIHKKDDDYLKGQALATDDPLRKGYDRERAVILRILLLVPVLVWIWVISYAYVVSLASMMVIGLYIWGLAVYEG